MATSSPQLPEISDPKSSDSSARSSLSRPPAAGGSWFARLLTFLIVIGILGGGVWGAIQWFDTRPTDTNASTMTAPVQRSDLVVTVVEDGNLESASNIDIKCDVAGGSSILWIIEDGTEVKEGDKIIELDSAALEESINQQTIAYEKARAAKIQAEKNYAAAKLAVDEYLQGTYVQAVQDQDAQITIAEENLRSAQNALEHSERMFRKGYISALDLESQKFSVQRAQLELDSARTAKDVLVKFTKEKMLQELESARDSAEAQAQSEAASYDLEKSRLERLQAQLEKCLILAPASGMVVYANEQGGRFGGSQSPTIEEGAMVRERQTILRLPDLARMQVKVNVHESKIEMLGRAMKRAAADGQAVRARIRILERELQGTLESIANQPEPSGWWSGNIKEYGTTVRIDGTPDGLRPGMTAECEILVEHLKDTLIVPVAAVVELRGEYFAWSKENGKLERRPLVLGATNDQFVEVMDGLVEDMQVVLNPRAVIPEARAVKEAVEDVDVTAKFGKEKQRPAGKGGPPMGPGASPGTGAPEGNSAEKSEKRPQPSLNQLDKDGDGKVTKEELPAPMQQYFDMIDSDGDGSISSSEMAKARQQREQSGGGGGGPPQ